MGFGAVFSITISSFRQRHAEGVRSALAVSCLCNFARMSHIYSMHVWKFHVAMEICHLVEKCNRRSFMAIILLGGRGAHAEAV